MWDTCACDVYNVKLLHYGWFETSASTILQRFALLMVEMSTIALLMVGREEQYCSVDGV